MAATTRGGVFPIVEIFGYPVDASSGSAVKSRRLRHCPFAETPCEKYRQYGFGYCSVTYAAEDDGGERQTYAVCDHRLDGEPLQVAIRDHFGSRSANVHLVPEIVLTNPRTSFDFAAFTVSDGEIDDLVIIETQAIDIRGGGVGPAWRAWEAGEVVRWREYFTKESAAKGRRDTVAYGVNMANIYKRLGMQVAVKGSYLKSIGIPFYVAMQDRPFQYLRRRIAFEDAVNDWDITFVTFDYSGATMSDGRLGFSQRQIVRSTLSNYVTALTSNARLGADERANFLRIIKRKAGL